MPDDSILEIVQGTISLQLMADRLIDAARDGGGSDNITVLLLRFEELPWYTTIFPLALRRRESKKMAKLFLKFEQAVLKEFALVARAW